MDLITESVLHCFGYRIPTTFSEGGCCCKIIQIIRKMFCVKAKTYQFDFVMPVVGTFEKKTAKTLKLHARILLAQAFYNLYRLAAFLGSYTCDILRDLLEIKLNYNSKELN